MDRVLDSYSDKQYRLIQQLSSQIAGRKPGRRHYDFKVAREHQDRRRQSPFKDIAHSYKSDVAGWIREDKHGAVDGLSLANAVRHNIHVLHHTYRRDFHEHLKTYDFYDKLKKHYDKQGGSLGSLLNSGARSLGEFSSSVNKGLDSAAKDTHNFLGRMKSTLVDTARSQGVQADVYGDDFLSKVGIRKRKYHSAEITPEMKLHARLAKSAYMNINERTDVDDWKYQRDDSSDLYSTYLKDGKAIVHFRGTSPGAALAGKNTDLIDDAHIAFGAANEMSGMDDARHRVNDLITRYGAGNVNLSSYSMGGGRAMELMRDKKIYAGLGNDNYMLAPGVTSLNPHLEEFAKMQKANYVYGFQDNVSNALLAHSNDHHHVMYNTSENAFDAHMMLDRLSK